MPAPIFVTGLPRSGTSLVTGVLNICGAWVGDTFPGDPFNRKGTFENKAIRENLLKPYLALIPSDPLGLDPLPPLNVEPFIDPQRWRKLVLDTVSAQGYRGGPWAYKDAKLALCWRIWAEAFPDAKWVIAHRPGEDVIASCIRAEPMARRMGYRAERWIEWASAYEKHRDGITRKVVPVRSDALFGDLAGIARVVEQLGLTWRSGIVRDFIDRRLWNAGR